MHPDWQVVPQFEGASSEEIHVPAADGVTVRVLRWTPLDAVAAQSRTLVMIPGWNSVIEGWLPILSEWVKQRPIISIETREKDSCVIDGEIDKSTFSMPNLYGDICLALRNLGIDSTKCDAFGSSLGATLLLEGLRDGALEFRSLTVLSPNLAFPAPLWAKIMMPSPVFFYAPLVRFVIWYLDKRLEEEGQRIRYRRTLLAAHIPRLRLCTLVFSKFKMDLDFTDIMLPIGILRASSDTLHDHGDAGVLDAALPKSTLIEIESNQFAHEPEAIPLIEAFQSSILS